MVARNFVIVPQYIRTVADQSGGLQQRWEVFVQNRLRSVKKETSAQIQPFDKFSHNYILSLLQIEVF